MGKSGSVSCGVTAPFSGVLVTQVFVCVLQGSDSPVLCKFWWLYGGVNGDLLQEGVCHTLVYCIQSPCPYRHKVKMLSRVRPFVTPWTAASQAPLSMGFSR